MSSVSVALCVCLSVWKNGTDWMSLICLTTSIKVLFDFVKMAPESDVVISET